MKKWFLWLLVILILTFLSIYVFIPSKIVISKIVASGAPISAEFRYVSNQEKWGKWWLDSAGKPHTKGDPFTYGGTTFRLTQIGYNVAGIEIQQDGLILQSELDLISISRDSTWAKWDCELPAGNNPFTRLLRYKMALELSKNMKAVLVNLNRFVSKPQNVYMVHIVRTSFTDTCMLSTRFTTSSYPSTAELYHYFDLLKNNILKQKAVITGYPMMNVRMLKTDSFETQLAIPTNHSLKDEGAIFTRKMVPGNFLTAVVKGGRYSVEESMREMENFLKDQNRTEMASPFQQLITDRMSEPDTTKWITRIYLPVAE